MSDHHDRASHRFGGPWTETKLTILRKYLRAYTTALKNQSFTTGYIDAFAGTGYRSQAANDGPQLALPDLAGDQEEALLKGYVVYALETQPRFDRYVFIEQDAERCAALDALKAQHPDLAADIKVCSGEANEEIRSLCAKNWRDRRAVLFLDPYGMQVEWQTIEAIARTKAIDLWLLFPLGIGVNRLLTRSGEIPEAWRHRLDVMFGTTDWINAFYRVEARPTLFDPEATLLIKERVDVIASYFVERLKTVFPVVAPNPRILRNSSGNPMYLFCFAASHPRALGIASDILGKID
nr:three-Cys-motif partner protein TcmP [Deltaproteobacteria bacterium]